MTRFPLFLLALSVFTFAASAQKKEIVELQRDVALLQDQVRTLQRSFDEKLSALTVLAQQTLDTANKANTSVAVLQNGVSATLREQEKAVMVPVAGVGVRVEQMTTEFTALKESIADLTSRTGKIQQQILDLSNAVKTMQALPPPPTGGSGPSAALPGPTGAPAISAEALYQNALRDKTGGKLDLALQEFTEYLKLYSNTDVAPNAQFYVGEIHYNQNQLDAALKEFDLVLEKFPQNNKTADAIYMKGQTLVKMGKKTQGAQEFRELIRRFPNSDLAAKARSQLKLLGLSASSTGRRR